MNSRILVLYDSVDGNTEAMATAVARGINAVSSCEALLRRTPPVSADTRATKAPVPDTGAPYAELADLSAIDGLVMGSPTHFGNMSASMKYFLDQTSRDWMSGTLTDKPAGVFTSTGSLHGGMEATLLSMMVPLLHHGMVLCGLPYSEPDLMQTSSGGTPYGPSHWSTENADRSISEEESRLCTALGRRVATMARRLKHD
ncbi:MAG: NAD(P)H:quinone oxidoreductase [Gammaproteobacteria bacterium]|nr:NAD(P)H:quinone oxidoreductase [Gammaproteobacteria bacterium]